MHEMKERPVDYLNERESVHLPVERIARVSVDGNTLNLTCLGRLSYVRGVPVHNSMSSSRYAFWEQHHGEAEETIHISIDFLNPKAFRLRASTSDVRAERTTPMVAGDIRQEFPLEVVEEENRYIVRTGAMEVELGRDVYGVTVRDLDGKVVARIGGPQRMLFGQFDTIPTGFVMDEGGVRATETLVLAHDEKILGMGERFSGINRRGETVNNTVEDGMGNASPRCYKPVPFMLSSQGYGMFYNTACPFRAWVGSQSHAETCLVFEDAELDYFFFYGPCLKDVIRHYTSLTGRAAMPPEWSFGYWVSRNMFNTGEEGLEVARRFREESLPADVIHFDGAWMGRGDGDDPLCNFSWDDETFGKREEIVRELRDLGFHISLWQLPYIDQRSTIYEEGRAAGAFVEGIVWGDSPRKAGVIDFSNPDAVEWYQRKVRDVLENGADAIKVDFGETSPSNVAYHGFSGKEMRNLYPLLYNKAAFEVVEQVKGEGNALIWARQAYAGSQRYPVHWSGDPDCNWETLPHMLKGGLSLALSGFTFWSSDLGGYLGKPSSELYIRWTQLAMFCSHVRAHGNTPREPWEFGQEAFENFRKYVSLRYRLMPYIIAEARYAAVEGLPFIRPLVLDYQCDPTVYHVEDEYIFGRSILVAPVVTEGARERRVYLPEGEWVDFWTKDTITETGWMTYPTPLDVMPLFVKKGSVIQTREGDCRY